MVAINNAVEVDLFGQVSSESSGFRNISGTGGQQDYTYAAYHSKGGKSFISLRSNKEGKDGSVKFRIVPYLEHGSIVTDHRATVQFVVTEWNG